MSFFSVNKSRIAILAISLSLLSACGGSSSSTPPDISEPEPTPVTQEFDYQALIDGAVNEDVPGIILEIDGPDIQFIGAAGYADTESQELMQTHHAMPAGSAGKKATALLVALLHQDGVLDIDALISTWLPDSLLSQIEHSEKMTLRQLLNHTAGVYDYLDARSSEEWFDAASANLDILKTDIDALQFALNRPSYFEPGEDFNYSNTGYLLTGLILDKVLNEHHHKALRSRILDPFGLTNTFYLGFEKELGEIISGYVIDGDDIINTKPLYENVGVADAPIATTVSDLSLLIRTIMTDDSIVNDEIRQLLLGEESLVLADADSNFYVGLGMFKNLKGDFTIFHHGGEEVGYKSSNIYIKELDTTVTTFFNCHGHSSCIVQTDEMIQQVLTSLIEGS